MCLYLQLRVHFLKLHRLVLAEQVACSILLAVGERMGQAMKSNSNRRRSNGIEGRARVRKKTPSSRGLPCPHVCWRAYPAYPAAQLNSARGSCLTGISTDASPS